MRSTLLAAGLACLLASAPACRPARHESDPGIGNDPRAASLAVPRSAHRTPTVPAASAATEEDAESPFAPMLRGNWREANGTHTYVVSVTGSQFTAIEFQKDREIGRYDGRLRGRQIDAAYESRAKGPVEGRAALELSNDGSHLSGAFRFKEQFTAIDWVRSPTE